MLLTSGITRVVSSPLVTGPYGRLVQSFPRELTKGVINRNKSIRSFRLFRDHTAVHVTIQHACTHMRK